MTILFNIKTRWASFRWLRFAKIGLGILIGLVITGAVVYEYLLASIYFDSLTRKYHSFDDENVVVKAGDQLVALDQLQQWFNDLDEVQQRLWLPWALVYSTPLMKARQIERFQQGMQQVVYNLDEAIQNIDNFDFESEKRAILQLGLVRRIQVITARIDQVKDKPGEVAEIPDRYLQLYDPQIDIDTSGLFDGLYKTHIRLAPPGTDFSNERNQLVAALEKLVSSSQRDIGWLLRYTELQGFADVKIDDFWPGSRWLTGQPFAPSVYTLSGMNFIENYLKELVAAAPKSTVIKAFRSNFRQQYQYQYLKSWLAFAEAFDDGKNKLRGRQEWRKAIEIMATPENPYFAVMKRIQQEIKPFKDEKVFSSQYLFDYFSRVSEISGKDTKANDKGEDNSLSSLDKDMVKAVDAFGSYQQGLRDLSIGIDSIKLSYIETVNASLNPNNIGSGRSVGAKTWATILDMQRVLGKPDDRSRLFWNLYSGPVKVAYEYMQMESACFLQDMWDQNVIAELEDVVPARLGHSLIGDEGLTWQYMDSFAEPFLDRRPRRGYQSNIDGGIEWTPEFIDFLNHAGKGRSLIDEEFNVRVSALPTGTNPSARLHPHQTLLELSCDDGVHNLANYNYYTSKDFEWSLGRCSDVTLEIQIGHLTLSKRYPGQKGFPSFLADFRDGRRVFGIQDFPRQQAQLRNENVRAIDVKYEFRGQEAIIEMLDAVPLQPPARIAECWH